MPTHTFTYPLYITAIQIAPIEVWQLLNDELDAPQIGEVGNYVVCTTSRKPSISQRLRAVLANARGREPDRVLIYRQGDLM